jgi:hypothetical protein
MSPAQEEETSVPSGDTAPTPVTTTLRLVMDSTFKISQQTHAQNSDMQNTD